jgi:uncharacterized coiled-coil protein SlyX
MTVALACFGVSPLAQAVSPAPDGGYPGGNTAEGQNALFSLTTGGGNTAIGWSSLMRNTIGRFNTGVGNGTLLRNTAEGNTATGCAALLSNTAGGRNTADGAFALYHSTGNENTAIGYEALFSNTTGNGNTAIGHGALVYNTTGNGNAAIGDGALVNNTAGSGNIAFGFSAGVNVTTADNVICLGEEIGGENLSNTTWISNIYGTTTQNGTTAPVIVSADGQLGTTSSSARFKKDVKPMDKASETVLALKPVTFHYKSDKTNTPQFGLVAEEVAEVDPDLVGRDRNGEIYTVRYDAVNAMLLNEFLKEHRKVEQQQATISQLESTVAKQEASAARQQKQIEALTAGLQKVSAQLEVSKPAPRTVLNNQ